MKGVRFKRQREEWKKDSGWTEKNGDWESEDVSLVKKPIHTVHIN
jgi:hypothetical protein